MIELSILRALCVRDNYLKYRNVVTDLKDLNPILAVVDSWFTQNSSDLTIEDLANLFYATLPAKPEEYRRVFDILAASPPPESVRTLLEALKRARVCQDISVAAFEASTGRKTVQELLELADQLRSGTEVEKVEFVSDDLNELLKATVQAPGLRWRLQCLNASLGSLRKGDFGFLFARPETGKTTFLASELTYMAEQARGPILWFSNEEQGSKVKIRCYQAALGARLEHLIAAPDRAKAKYEGLTNNRILIYDNASISKHQVQTIVQELNPALVVFDQIDKITGFPADRDDIMYGRIYQWARELAKTYCPVIGVCQASGEAEGVQFLNMAHVANAKTAKQAEADWILGIGKQDNPEFERIRYFSVCKNKLLGDQDTDPAKRHMRTEVLLKADVARYEDIL